MGDIEGFEEFQGFQGFTFGELASLGSRVSGVSGFTFQVPGFRVIARKHDEATVSLRRGSTKKQSFRCFNV